MSDTMMEIDGRYCVLKYLNVEQEAQVEKLLRRGSRILPGWVTEIKVCLIAPTEATDNICIGVHTRYRRLVIEMTRDFLSKSEEPRWRDFAHECMHAQTGILSNHFDRVLAVVREKLGPDDLELFMRLETLEREETVEACTQDLADMVLRLMGDTRVVEEDEPRPPEVAAREKGLAYHEGQEAAKRGLPSTDNPFSLLAGNNSGDRWDWFEGWDEAKTLEEGNVNMAHNAGTAAHAQGEMRESNPYEYEGRVVGSDRANWFQGWDNGEGPVTSNAYQLGQCARSDGLSRDGNPYRGRGYLDGEINHNHWNNGWDGVLQDDMLPEDTAYNKGVNASWRGDGRDTNPYHVQGEEGRQAGPNNHQNWYLGWDHAKEQIDA